MKISIVIPTLNEEKLLEGLLNQLLSETNERKYDCEIIISDGGSRDNTINIAEKYGCKVVLKESECENIAIGRNRGADNSKGECIVFLNGDVRIEDPKLFFSEIDSFLEKDYLAMTVNVKVFPEEEILSDRVFMGFYNNYFHLLNIIGLGMGRGECQIIKRSVFFENNGYNNELPAGEDFDLYKRIRKEGKIKFNRKINIFESPRRYRKDGHFKVLLKWFTNSVSIIFKKKAYSKEWEQVR